MSTRAVGNKGEDFAAAVLQKLGCELLCRNYYTPYGEIDLVARDGSCVAFVEVKARREGSMGTPGEAVNRRKQGRIAKSALCWLMEHPQDLQPRFDVFEIVMAKGDEFAVRSYQYLKNAYEVTEYESI